MIYNEEEKKFLNEYIPGHHHHEIAEAFNARFERNITARQVQTFVKYYKIRTGYDGRFKSGHIPANKGKAQQATERMKETWFKPGHRPVTYRPIGSERIDKDGYIKIKVSDNKWELKHRLVYEQYHGKIPKGHIIIFRDNDKQNCSIENLMVISRRQNALLNKKHMQVYKGELKDSALLICELECTINKKRKARGKAKDDKS